MNLSKPPPIRRRTSSSNFVPPFLPYPTNSTSSFLSSSSHFPHCHCRKNSVHPSQRPHATVVSAYQGHENIHSSDTRRAALPTSSKTPRPRSRPILLQEIINSQRLRKSGNWRAALQLMEGVRTKVEGQSQFLNEMLLIRVAELREKKPGLAAGHVYKELCKVWEGIPARRTTTTYNAVLSGLRGQKKGGKGAFGAGGDGGDGELRVAHKVLEEMIEGGVHPDHFTMSILFQMCAASKNLVYAERFLEKATREFGFEPNVISGTALVNAYAKCGQVDTVEKIFWEMKGRGVLLNEWTYVAVISVYHQKGLHDKVMECFKEALGNVAVELNGFVISGVVASCMKAKDVKGVKWVYDLMSREGVKPTEEMFGMMFETAVRAGAVKFGTEVLFDWAPRHNLLEVTPQLCGRLVAAGKKGDKVEAGKMAVDVRRVVVRMKEVGVMPTVGVLNALISTFVKLKLHVQARHVLEQDFGEHGLSPDIVTYNTLIHGLGMSDRPELALKVLRVMKKRGVEPNEATYNVMAHLLLEHKNFQMAAVMEEEIMGKKKGGGKEANVAAQFKLLRASKSVNETLKLYRACIKRGVVLDEKSYGVILSTLYECGREDEAMGIMGLLFLKNGVTTGIANVVMKHWCQIDQSAIRSMRLFKKIKDVGIGPDAITYTTLIVWHSREGLLDAAFRLLGEMQDVGFGMQDSHVWSGIIDACGKSGQWERGIEVLKSMQKGNGGGMVSRPGVECYNAALYGAGMSGGWDGVLEVWRMLKDDEGVSKDGVTWSAIGSCILKNRFRIREWGLVREVHDEMREWIDAGKGKKTDISKVERKMMRVQWLLDVAVVGKKLKRGVGNKVVGVVDEEEEEGSKVGKE